jgi:hypothetical protein
MEAALLHARAEVWRALLAARQLTPELPADFFTPSLSEIAARVGGHRHAW